MTKYNVAVIGATGSVGREIINILAERDFPVKNIFAVASNNSIGKQVSFGDDKTVPVTPLENLDYRAVDLIFSCVSSKVSQEVVTQARKHNILVIDKSSFFRMDDDVPLVVPEVNIHSVKDEHKLIANPNCCVVPLVTALKPLDQAATIKRLVISTYQSVSGAGKKAMDELYESTKARYMMLEKDTEHFTRTIAFNIIPQIEDFEEDGYSGEEEKIINETQKIMGHPIDIDVTAVRVPVFIGHSLSVNIEFENELAAKEAEEILSEAESVSVMERDSSMKFITPFEAAGEDFVYVSRIRNNLNKPTCLSLWIVCDNLRKGAALNAVQIAENLLNIKIIT